MALADFYTVYMFLVVYFSIKKAQCPDFSQYSV